MPVMGNTAMPEPANQRGILGLDLTYVWVVGLSVAVALLWGLVFGFAHSLWVPFALEGTLVPSLALLIGLRASPPATGWVRMGLAAVALGLGVVYLLARSGEPGVAVLIVLVLCAGVAMREARHRREPWLQYINPLLVLLALAASVAVALTLIWWWDTPADLLLGDVFPVAVCLVATYVVVVKLWGPADGRSGRWMLAQAVAVFGVAAIVFLAFRTDYLYWQIQAFFHGSDYIGPADLIRQGGTLLWNVPSQYGFLSVQMIAWLPVGSSWEALFLLNGVSETVMALVIFSIIRGQRRGVRDTVASLAITLAAVFLRPFPADGVHSILFWSSNIFPSTGAYRFIWCVLLLALVYRAGRDLSAHPASRRLLCAGCGVWLIGCLWSVESALYCSIIWLPAFAWLAHDRVWRLPTSKRWRQLGIWILLPLGAMLLSILGLELIYAIGTGRGPDFYAYFEYALAYQNGFGAYPLDPGGTVWVLLLIIGMLVAALVDAARSRRSGPFAAAFTAAAAVWITSSYFVGRAHPNNVMNLAPIFFAAIFVVFHIWRRSGPAGRPIVGLIRLVAAPILIVLVVASFANQTALGELVGPGVHDGMTDVSALVANATDIDPALQSALNAAGVQPSDPIVYIPTGSVVSGPLGTGYPGSVMPAWTPASNPSIAVRDSPAWLPLNPTTEILVLPLARRDLYIDRFVTQYHLSGWLVESADSGMDASWLTADLAKHYQVTRTFKSGVWTVSWYQYQG